jgi:hypothetical protein
MFHVVLKEVPLQTDMFGLLVDQGVMGVALWLSSHMVVVPVMGSLKISPIRWRMWSPSLVASAGE